MPAERLATPDGADASPDVLVIIIRQIWLQEAAGACVQGHHEGASGKAWRS